MEALWLFQQKNGPIPSAPAWLNTARLRTGSAEGWGDNRFYLCKPVSLADHVWGLFTLQGWGIAPGELTPDHTQGCFSCHFSTLPYSLCRIKIKHSQNVSWQGFPNGNVCCQRPLVDIVFLGWSRSKLAKISPPPSLKALGVQNTIKHEYFTFPAGPNSVCLESARLQWIIDDKMTCQKQLKTASWPLLIQIFNYLF